MGQLGFPRVFLFTNRGFSIILKASSTNLIPTRPQLFFPVFFSERSLCCHAALTHTQAHHAPPTVRAPVPKLCLCVLNSSVISVGSDAGGAREGVMTIHGIWSLLGSLLERKVCYYEALAGRRVGIDASMASCVL